MSALFNYHDDSDEPLYVRLDTLVETHDIEPAHLLADPDCPLVVAIGPGRYVSRKDLAWLLHRRAEEALSRRRSGAVLESDASELADAVRKAASEDRFYVPRQQSPSASPEQTGCEPETVPA